MSRLLCLAAFALFLLAPPTALTSPALAVQPDEILDDPVLESRARDLSQVIRCVVCQNESIDSSNADLAKDLRVLVRERLVAGDSDQEVLDYLVARYGDFVLLRPPFKPATYLLWFGPPLLFVLALIGVLAYLRGQGRSAARGTSALTPEEEARLSQLLEENGTDRPEAGDRP